MARRAIAGCRGIITGATAGIGRALAAEMVRGGARLLVIGRRAERLDELVASLSAAGGEAVPLAGDVTSAEFRRTIVETAGSKLGGLDLLINNAGRGAMGNFSDASSERLRQVMEVNFFAPAELVRVALPLLATGNRPMIVNIDSVLAHRAVPGSSEYCASKFALRGLSDSLRAELAPCGIDVLSVSPARTDTEFFEKVDNPHLTGWPRLKGMSAEKVARKTVRAIRSGRHELVISAGGKLLVWTNRLLPRVLDYALARKS